MKPDTLRRARRHLVRRDAVLGDLIRLVGPCRWADRQTDLFAALVRAITSQQLSAKAADTILGRVAALLTNERIEPAAVAALPPSALRAAGLSGRKVEYVQDLARHVRDGTLNLRQLHRLPDDEVIRVLTAIRGVGRWTAEMILIFRLNRPDVLPLDDIGLQRAVQRAYRLRRRPTPLQFTRMAEEWRPWRSVACWYLWASLDRPPRA